MIKNVLQQKLLLNNKKVIIKIVIQVNLFKVVIFVIKVKLLLELFFYKSCYYSYN